MDSPSFKDYCETFQKNLLHLQKNKNLCLEWTTEINDEKINLIASYLTMEEKLKLLRKNSMLSMLMMNEDKYSKYTTVLPTTYYKTEEPITDIIPNPEPFYCLSSEELKKIHPFMYGLDKPITIVKNPLTNFEMVDEFHATFGHPRPKELQRDALETQPDLIKLRVALVTEEYKELLTAVVSKDIIGVIDALGDLLYVIYGMGVALGIDLNKVFKLVHESNMTKLCKTVEEACKTIEYYKTLPGFETTIVGHRPSDTGNGHVVYDVKTGKILKSMFFKLPNFESVFPMK